MSTVIGACAGGAASRRSRSIVMTGVAVPAPVEAPPIGVTYKDRHWDIAARRRQDRRAQQGSKDSWGTDAPVHGVDRHGVVARAVADDPRRERQCDVRIPGDPPARHRCDRIDERSGRVDAGARHQRCSVTSISPVGDVALAVRLDKSIKRDFIAAYAANALLIYVYPLPEILRADPVGVAIALDDERVPEAVVVFHDGDMVTILPPLSSPPTAPGAARGPLENPTP